MPLTHARVALLPERRKAQARPKETALVFSASSVGGRQSGIRFAYYVCAYVRVCVRVRVRVCLCEWLRACMGVRAQVRVPPDLSERLVAAPHLVEVSVCPRAYRTVLA